MDSNTEPLDLCKVCLTECDFYDNPAIRCDGKCQQKVHIRCLDRGALPSNFIGDVFYDLFCTTCSDSNEEFLIRQKMSWLTAVILTMYNLREKSSGISRRGYFHWKSDISMFINTNWDQLFGKTTKQKKNWIGTVSGTLSHYSGVFFKSGTAELGDQGWWKLIDTDPPEVLVNKYHKVLELKKQNQTKLKSRSNSVAQLHSSICYDYSSKKNGLENLKTEKPINSKYTIEKPINSDYETEKPINSEYKTEKTINSEYKTESNSYVSKSISPTDEFRDILDLDIDIPNIENDFPSFHLGEDIVSEEFPFQDCNEVPEIYTTNYEDTLEVPSKEPSHNNINPSSIETTENVQDDDEVLKIDSDDDDDDVDMIQETENNDNDRAYDLPPPLPSLFTQRAPKPLTWDETIKFDPDKVRPLMSEREEEFLLQKIEKYKHLLDTAPASIRRLYRKLVVRKLKRQYGLPLLNIDNVGENVDKGTLTKKKGNSVLDRFITEDISIYFEQRLCGQCESTSVHSPYTNRLLKPYIRRDTTSSSLWLNVMNELLAKVNKNKFGWKPESNAPIDYSYIRPQHVPAINSLCRQYFWPGIDLTECLQYPDFTCVVLYKKVVIGFAIMVPDVGYNEAYISFLLVRPEWRRAGIGTFMLYHLIQTCMGKDITLHVSATNPALILYQKFGFKQEEFIQDFYDKYILPSSNESKHALFLRLSR